MTESEKDFWKYWGERYYAAVSSKSEEKVRQFIADIVELHAYAIELEGDRNRLMEVGQMVVDEDQIRRAEIARDLHIAQGGVLS